MITITTSILLALLPYCTPMQNTKQLIGCIEYLYICTEFDSEENCIEELPVDLWPK